MPILWIRIIATTLIVALPHSTSAARSLFDADADCKCCVRLPLNCLIIGVAQTLDQASTCEALEREFGQYKVIFVLFLMQSTEDAAFEEMNTAEPEGEDVEDVEAKKAEDKTMGM